MASEYYDDVPNGKRKGNVVSADLMDLPFKEERFDLVISEDVFEHICDYNKAFLEVRRVLVRGGIIYLRFRCMKEEKLFLGLEMKRKFIMEIQ